MPRLPLTLDHRHPSIVVPLTGSTSEELAAQVAALSGAPVDIVEWRVDLYSDLSGAAAELDRLAAALPETPLLVTVRTTAEGGAAGLDDDEYASLVTELASAGTADAVDVEYRRPRAADVIAAARSAGTPVVASNHDFDATPDADEIVARLAAMETAGADVAKIAVMPRSAADVVTLLDATERRHRTAENPLITMSMGALGAVTRIGGGAFGSAATFATVGEASAPGQLPAAGVRAALDLLH